ncbi:hypothetical protein SA496_26760 [Pseudomonas sp. JS3066]|jgi:hypothetical protein|uniref:hypothetical protein n=1 Tax=unclassified Pseudomonas TaxID=196821 RepID=UPI00129EC47F|nr:MULTISPECIES: hypothetical protein [unclassified Pseudomonas]MDH4651866.1 hypothetical protein [Pseudomonas sp. BN606]MRK21697.1 hypothetical protein [Pseudomonas sp. JG-B]WVK93266.1 hypothetical protein SA496_26760 [Pseudomonas sp. JS3066]
MQRNAIFTAVFAVFSLFFSQLTLAEESNAFVARNAALAEQRADAAQQEAIAKQGAEQQKQSDAHQDS